MNYFSTTHSILFICAMAFLILAVYFYLQSKSQLSFISLLLGTALLGTFVSVLDPFLHLWDEQYHALVAKNMLSNPFKPMLYLNPVLDYDRNIWTDNHVWLHKQPLFLWQMALSLKMFGINALAVRIPSILMHTIATYFVYAIGKTVLNYKTGFLGALFFAVAYYPLALVAGRMSTDHNDVAFSFYVLGSFWAWFKYQETNRGVFLVLIGAFSGGAVLIKWLFGLLIFAVWSLVLFQKHKLSWNLIKASKPLFIAFGLAIAIFLPWQIYIFHYFPLEANIEFNYTAQHLFVAVENHGGDAWFHFRAFHKIYGSGDLVPVIYLLGTGLFLWKIENKSYKLTLAAALLITYLFYTIAATKMDSFTIVVAPFFFLGLGHLLLTSLNLAQNKIKPRWLFATISSLVIITTSASLFKFTEIRKKQTNYSTHDNDNRHAEMQDYQFTQRLKSELNAGQFVLFNVHTTVNSHISTMFFTNFVAYSQIPTEEDIACVKKQLMKIAIINTGNLPESILNDSTIVKISDPKIPVLK